MTDRYKDIRVGEWWEFTNSKGTKIEGEIEENRFTGALALAENYFIRNFEIAGCIPRRLERAHRPLPRVPTVPVWYQCEASGPKH
jgi:hypothetical protein